MTKSLCRNNINIIRLNSHNFEKRKVMEMLKIESLSKTYGSGSTAVQTDDQGVFPGASGIKCRQRREDCPVIPVLRTAVDNFLVQSSFAPVVQDDFIHRII